MGEHRTNTHGTDDPGQPGRGDGVGPDGPGDAGSALPIGALLRAGADGELTQDQTARLDEMLTACTCGCDRGRACACQKFESDLRAACGRVMGRGCAPEGLRARVVAAMQQGAHAEGVVDHPAGHSGPSQAGRAAPGRRVAGRLATGRRRWTMLGAVALVAVMLSGAVYQALLNARSASNESMGVTAQLASFVSTEHHRTAVGTEPGQAKFTCRDVSRICSEFTPMLGSSPALPEATAGEGLEFQGAARCGVPGGPSIHVRYYTVEAGDGQRHEVSLFIQRDTGRLEMEDGKVYRLNCPRSDACVWRRDGLVYFAVADDAVGCHAIRAAAGVGDPVGVLKAK